MSTLLRNRVTGLASAALSLALLGGCLSDSPDSSGSSDGNFSFELESKVRSIQAPAGDSAGVLRTERVEYYCDGSDVMADTLLESQLYSVGGGKLNLWDEEDCSAFQLSGSSSTVIGKWTTNTLYAQSQIPAAYRPSFCDEEEEDEEDIDTDEVFNDIKMSYDISETRVKGTISGKICMGKFLAQNMGAGSQDTPFTLVSSDCASATIGNTLNDEKLKISTKFSGDVLQITMASGGKSCTGSEDLDLVDTPPTCPVSVQDDEDDAFQECVNSLPFFEGMEDDLQKRGSKSVFEVVKKLNGSISVF